MGNGFIITCVINKEEKAFREFKDIVDSSNFNINLAEKIETKMDFSKQLALDLNKLRIKSSFIIKDKHKGILLVQNMSETSPVYIFNRLREKMTVFKNILRVLPLDLLYKFDHEIIQDFVRNHTFCGSYKIMFEGRLCQSDQKDRVFAAIIPIVENVVSLVNPENVIVVQAFKSAVGISIMKNDSKNFNFSK